MKLGCHHDLLAYRETTAKGCTQEPPPKFQSVELLWKDMWHRWSHPHGLHGRVGDLWVRIWYVLIVGSQTVRKCPTKLTTCIQTLWYGSKPFALTMEDTKTVQQNFIDICRRAGFGFIRKLSQIFCDCLGVKFKFEGSEPHFGCIGYNKTWSWLQLPRNREAYFWIG